MSNRLFRRVVSLVLSAVVLTWGTVPLAAKHAHVDGDDVTHRHGNCHKVAEHAADDHSWHGHDHELATTDRGSDLMASVFHLHWQWLGIGFSMPVPEEPATEGDDEGSVSLLTVLRVEQNVAGTQAGDSFVQVLLTAMGTPNADVVRTLTPVPRSPNLVTSIPLCDSARLERTGVLLA